MGFVDSKKNIEYNQAKTDCQVHNSLICYLQSAVRVYDILSFVYSNMGFITFGFMALLTFVWLLAVTGRVDLL